MRRQIEQFGGMKRAWVWMVLAAAITGCIYGCAKSPATPAPTPAAGVAPSIPTQAQPKLRTIKLWMGKEEMVTEMAVTELQEQTGMMFRTNMAENEGMIFVFDQPKQANFWMMNTILPLSAAYIDADGKILEIHDLQPHDTNSVKAATENIQFVLETRQGWFQRHGITTNMAVSTERGSLKKVFLEK